MPSPRVRPAVGTGLPSVCPGGRPPPGKSYRGSPRATPQATAHSRLKSPLQCPHWVVARIVPRGFGCRHRDLCWPEVGSSRLRQEVSGPRWPDQLPGMGQCYSAYLPVCFTNWATCDVSVCWGEGHDKATLDTTPPLPFPLPDEQRATGLPLLRYQRPRAAREGQSRNYTMDGASRRVVPQAMCEDKTQLPECVFAAGWAR